MHCHFEICLMYLHTAIAQTASLVITFSVSLTHTHTHTTILQLGFCPGQPGWASTRRNIHPLTPIMVTNHPLSASSIYYDPWHPPWSFVLNLHAWQSFSTISPSFLLSTSWPHPPVYTPYIFTQSFHSTYPYHRNLFCCSTEIMSSNPSLSTLYLFNSYLVA